MNDDKKQQLATAVEWGVILLVAASITLVVFMAVLGLTGDGGGPSCKDRGGRLVLVHMIPIPSGKITIMVPVYRCEEVAP